MRPGGLHLLGCSLKGAVPLWQAAGGTKLTRAHPHPVPPLQVEWENAELKGQLRGVKQERDSALRKSQGLQSKLESLEQVLKVRGSCGWRRWDKPCVRACVPACHQGLRGSGATSPWSLPALVFFVTEGPWSKW